MLDDIWKQHIRNAKNVTEEHNGFILKDIKHFLLLWPSYKVSLSCFSFERKDKMYVVKFDLNL